MQLRQYLGFLAYKRLLLKPIGWNLAFLSLMLLGFSVGKVQAATELRIAIKKSVSEIQVGSSTPAVVKDAAGRTLGTVEQMQALAVLPSGNQVALGEWRASQLSLEPQADGFVWIGDRWYRGRVRLLSQGKGVTAVNQVGLEEYLYSVVGAEAIPSWPLEALKTQAVAARTFALYRASTSSNRLYDLDSTVRSQVYKGLESEYLSTQEAVRATDNEVMTYKGKVILAAFHSSSGGHTENVEDVWSSPLPYLRGVVDYDQTAPVFQWQERFTVNELSRRIGGIGQIRALTPERTTPTGRISTIRIVGDRGSKTLSGTKLREALDLRSSLFTVTANNGTFEINGRGYGHGIGLSQWGTYYLATQGVDYRQILSHYYQNARLSQLGN